tara:strand:+ start:107660 stop:108940 length:1281 start_codon:yes stop_codon:yes gene_type:complete
VSKIVAVVNENKNTLLPTMMSVIALLFSFMLVCLGHGLLNTMLSVRAAMESFSSLSVGIIGFCYFAGFIFGVSLCTRLISVVGHIRAFAALGSLTSALSIAFLLSINLPSWMILRFTYGVCIAALYMVIESWLNSLSTNGNRAQVLSIYMVLIYLSFSVSQLLLNIGSLGSFHQFVIVSMLFSVSIVPLCISSKAKPIEIASEPINFKKLVKHIPYGSISCLCGGMVVGSMWTMLGAFLEFKKFSTGHISLFIAMTFMGALIFQFPLGKLSDIANNRRSTIKFASLVGSFVFFLTFLIITYSNNTLSLSLLFLLMGGFSYPIYSLSLAHIIDHLDSKHIVSASGSLILINAIGSMLGSLICSAMMILTSVNAFLWFGGIILSLNFAASYLFKPKTSHANSETNFIALPRTTMALNSLDPRIPTETE